MKPNLLILTDWYLPAVNAGGPVRSVSAIVDRLKESFNISILTSDRDFGADKPFKDIQIDTWITQNAYRIKYCSAEKVDHFVKEEIQNTDYHKIYMNSLFSVSFTVKPIRLLDSKTKANKVVLAPRGMLGKGALAIKPFKKKLFLTLAKAFGWYKGITWNTSSDLESNEVKHVFGNKAKTVALENLAACKQVDFKPLTKQQNELRLIFVSRISEKKNLNYLLSVLKNCSASITLDIYGPIEDESYWKQSKNLINSLPQKVAYKGIIQPENLQNVISDYHLMVLPTMHENFGHIILESLSASVPVLLSDNTPWLNLAEESAGNVLSLSNDLLWKESLEDYYSLDNNNYQEQRNGAWNLANVKLQNESLFQGYLNLFS